MRLKNIIFSIFLIIIVFSLVGCGKKDESKELNEKVESSVKYVEDSLIEILNALNNISFKNYYVVTEKIKLDSKTANDGESSTKQDESSSSSGTEGSSGDEEDSKITINNMKSRSILLSDKTKINWENIKSQTENLSSIWNAIIIDLYKIGVSNENILKFSDYLDNAIINVKQENKELSLSNFSNLYSLLPVFMETFVDDRTKINLQWIKAYCVKAYVATSIKDWNTTSSQIAIAEQNYSAIMSDAEFVNKKPYNTNKTYVSLKELQNSVNLQDEDVFFMKYKNFMEEICLLCDNNSLGKYY